MPSKDDKEEETKSNSENDDANPANSMVESSKKKKLKRFDFVTKGGEHVHFTAKKIKEQKRIEESLKAELAKQEVEKVKKDLFDLMGIDVVTKGPITLKVYREDGTTEVIPKFKNSDLHLAEWTETRLPISWRGNKPGLRLQPRMVYGFAYIFADLSLTFGDDDNFVFTVHGLPMHYLGPTVTPKV
uniref:Uncharacterized protein n=1 Tax=Tanacetum cinerariifolium TaxID=118510 RepID=A0A6L2LM22_TANCI|nr:hypothetical protein [Tanacetum cinerariifolium]